MHPTVDEQLRGVRRLLDAVAGAEQLSPRSSAALDDARSILRRLEWSWSAVLPFLDWDNRATAALLTELAVFVPRAMPDPLPDELVTSETELDFATAHRRNLALRARLADAVAVLGAPGVDERGADAARARVVAHLRARLERDPANRRRPAQPGPGSDPTADPTNPGGAR